MSISTMTVRAKVAVAATAVAASAVVLPFQAIAAHASTPDDDLSACINTAIANISDTDSFSAAIDACVNTYFTELGIDTSTMTTTTATDTTTVAPTDDSGGVSINTGILGNSDSDPTMSTTDVTAS
jgi:hypothetical protein